MKPKILLIGGGGHCAACIDVIEQEGKFDIAGIVDANERTAQFLGYPILGSDEDLHALRMIYQYAIVTLGQIKCADIRIRLFNLLTTHNFILPIIISPRAYVAKNASLGNGSIIMHDALINARAKIGINCIINTKALIEHDARIGDHSHISTAAVINGNVSVGQQVFVGSNAVVKESSQIKDNFFVRAGSLYFEA